VVERAITKAKDASLQFNAMCVAALKRAYPQRLNSREIPPDTTTLNRTPAVPAPKGNPLLTEENFDGPAVNWLEKAASEIASRFSRRVSARDYIPPESLPEELTPRTFQGAAQTQQCRIEDIQMSGFNLLNGSGIQFNQLSQFLLCEITSKPSSTNTGS
jgi:hypothetical protein